MQLKDYSDLKDAGADRIEIPLNGEIYYAEPDPPAEVVLAASGMNASAAGLIEEMARANIDPTDPEAMQKLAQTKPMLAMRMAVSSGSASERAIRFLDEVLDPESALRWAQNMRARPPLPPCPGGVDPDTWADTWVPSEQAMAEHRHRRITLPQVMAVFQSLIGAYANRPTEPSSSLPNGRGGTGGTSTAGAPAVGA